MQASAFFKRVYIKLSRYLFGKRFLPVMEGPLKGYLWSTASSYEYILGNYEDPETIKTFLSWLKPGTVFYDLGANAGFYALLANRFISTGRIYSFEPSPAAQEIFQQHVKRNQSFISHDNIRLLPYALSDAEKQVEFSNDELRKEGNTYITGSSVFSHADKYLTVPCYSIDGLLKLDYDKPDIIKIDVEGAEYDVLQGALETLKKYKPNLLLATHDYHLPGVKNKCVQLLQQLGYHLIHTGGYNKHLPGLDDYIAVHESRRTNGTPH
ncbi:MAG TPA: FkbM family methyltransferase [Ferruginibacter sp.]|nr:FkbM family methyltransferase [Ferruginibacter sp.]